MGDAFITARGGGTAGLNFKVVDGTSAPSNPVENTIWVNTDVGITGWAFSATAPGSPTNGMVWFRISDLGPVPFNALKKNELQVFPVSCQQYAGGAWVKKTAKTYQNGAWRDWLHPIYWLGQQHYTLQLVINNGGSLSLGETDFTITDTKNASGDYTSRVSFTDCELRSPWKALCMHVLEVVASVDVGIVSTPNYGSDIDKGLAYLKITSPGLHRLDISDIGTTGYIQIAAKNSSATFDKIWLEA